MKIIFTVIISLLFITLLSFYLYYFQWKLAPAETNHSSDLSSKISPAVRLKRELLKKEIEEFFWKNRIQLAKEDNFNLMIYIPDSTFSLEIKGISVHQSKILRHRFSKSLDLDSAAEKIKDILTKPLQIAEEWATIDKEPIRVMDISEMKDLENNLSFIPQDKDTTVVCVVIKLVDHLSIGLKQAGLSNNDSLPLFYQSNSQHLQSNEKNSFPVYREYYQLLGDEWIELQIPKSDLITIFRAINHKSKILLCI